MGVADCPTLSISNAFVIAISIMVPVRVAVAVQWKIDSLRRPTGKTDRET
jgi:hypothetical protein